MPLCLWLATFLGSLFSSLVAFFFTYMTKRLAIVVAVVIAIASVTLVFFAAVAALMNAIVAASPPFFSTAVSLVVPDNFPLIVSTVLSAHVLRWVYVWNVKVIQYRLF